MTEKASQLRHTKVLWFIDNVAALMALVNGTSRSASLDGLAKTIHLAAFALNIVSYFEYVESAANWSDEISRLGVKGKWAAAMGFNLTECAATPILLGLPCIAVVRVFAHL